MHSLYSLYRVFSSSLCACIQDVFNILFLTLHKKQIGSAVFLASVYSMAKLYNNSAAFLLPYFLRDLYHATTKEQYVIFPFY